MAVEQREAGIVRHKVHFGLLISAHHHDILHDTRACLSGELGQFETVTVKMDGMDVVACVAYTNAGTPALLQVK